MKPEGKIMLLTNRITRPGKKITPMGLVIHWTANTKRGADAKANRDYFESWHKGRPVSSAHYIVDDHGYVQCVPELEMAYHVGAKKYKTDKFGNYPNNRLIGIEMCVNEDGLWPYTYINTIRLAADILKRHGWTTNDLYRHYDITGKDCPQMLIDEGAWLSFKRDIEREMKPLVSDYKGHWAEKFIARAKELGIMSGDPDGNFRPDESLTRAELATVAVKLHDAVVKEIMNAMKGGK